MRLLTSVVVVTFMTSCATSEDGIAGRIWDGIKDGVREVRDDAKVLLNRVRDHLSSSEEVEDILPPNIRPITARERVSP